MAVIALEFEELGGNTNTTNEYFLCGGFDFGAWPKTRNHPNFSHQVAFSFPFGTSPCCLFLGCWHTPRGPPWWLSGNRGGPPCAGRRAALGHLKNEALCTHPTSTSSKQSSTLAPKLSLFCPNTEDAGISPAASPAIFDVRRGAGAADCARAASASSRPRDLRPPSPRQQSTRGFLGIGHK